MTESPELGLKETVFSDKEKAEAHIASISDSISDVDYADDGFHLSYAGGALGQCALHRGSTSALSYSVRRSQDLHFIMMQSGAVRFRSNSEASEALPSRSGILLGPESRGRSAVEPDSAGISMITTEQAVRQFATRFAGREIDVSGERMGVRQLDFKDPVVSALARNIAGTFHELQALSRSGLSRLVLGQFDEMLLALASVAAVPELRAAVGEVRAGSGAQSVRQAREFIHAHVTEPISFAELAERLGVGLRSLQLAFRRELGCTPRDYLMACRLELVRERLLTAESGSTVTQIAFECGFTDMAVFSRKYRENFGERPSATLRRR